MRNGNKNTYYLTDFEYQIESDYEKLKRELGYPTNSFLDFFKRLNFLDKLIYLVVLFLFAFGIYLITNSILFLLNGDVGVSIGSFIYGLIAFFAIYVIFYPTRHQYFVRRIIVDQKMHRHIVRCRPHKSTSIMNNNVIARILIVSNSYTFSFSFVSQRNI